MSDNLSGNENEEPQNKPVNGNDDDNQENNINNKEDNNDDGNQDDNGMNNEEPENNEQNDDFNQDNEFPNEDNSNNDNRNKEDNNDNNNDKNNENENKDNLNNESKFNATEKLDESNNPENNNVRFSSLKSDKSKANNDDNNKSNGPLNKDNESGFVYDDDYNNNNDNNGNNDVQFDFENHEFYNPNKSGNNNQNQKMDENNNNDFGFKEDNDNHDYENDFDFGNNDNNFNNKNNINEKNVENNQNNQNNPLRNRSNNNFNNNNNNNYNQNNNNNYNQNNNNFNYNANPYGPNNNNNYVPNGSSNYGYNVNNTNQTAMNFIPQERPVISSLNYPQNSQEQNNHPDYDPYYEQYEELPEDGDGQNLDPKKKGKDSSKTAGSQIANTIMGAGILSIPIIMRYLGILLGSIFIIFLALSTIYSVYILIRCHQITGKNGYSMFGKITMGKFGSMLIKIIIIINNLGLCIAYFRIFGEVVQTIVQAWVSPDSYWATNWHNYFYILMCSLVMIFFIFIKNISSLKKVAYLGVFAVLVFTISLSVLLFYKSAQYELESYPGWNFMVPNCSFYEAFHAIPTVFLAFLFQFNVFPIYLSLKHKNMETMMKATKVGVGYSLINFLIVGIVGFLLYGLDMEDTILNSLSDDMVANRYRSTFIKVLIIIICISFVTTCLTSFPILFLSLRENYVNSILFCFKNCCRKKDDEDKVKINQGVYEKKKRYKYISDKVLIIITIVLYFLIVAIAIVMPKLKLIFTIVGATAGTFIAFILPNLFYIRICKISGKSYNIVLPLIFLCLGIFFLIVSITVTFF